MQWDQYFENLTKDGGIRSAGWLDGDSYYLAAPDGIRELDLKSGGTKLVKEMDLRLCGRAELKKTALPEGPEWAVVCSVAETVGEYGYPQEWKTVVLGVDESFESMGQVELPLYASAVEWGKTSVMISDGGEAFQSILVDLKSMTGQEAVRAGRRELKSSCMEHPGSRGIRTGQMRWRKVPFSGSIWRAAGSTACPGRKRE